jgi:glycerol kinase
MPETYIGALDLGTTSNRFILFDHQGQMVGLDQKEHEQIFPSPGGWNTIPWRSGKTPRP